MRIRRGPRLLSRLQIPLILAGLVAPPLTVALEVLPASAVAATCPSNSSFGSLCLLSTSQWKEDPGSQAVHIVGELRNDGPQALSGITINFDLLDSSGKKVGSGWTLSALSILGGTERTPFEDVLNTPPAGYDHFRVTSIPSGPATSTPLHLTAATDSGDTCPTGDVCQDVTNNSGATLDNLWAYLSFYDGSGNILARDEAPISGETTGSSSLAPGEIGTFIEDPSWLTSFNVTYTSYAVVTEPDYAVDLNPASLPFSGQVVGTASPADHVTLTNMSPRALAIGQVAVSGDFTQTNNCGASVAANGDCTIDVTFTPKATGARSGSLSVTDDGAGSPQSISLAGTGTMPVASISPDSLIFPSIAVGGTTDAQTVTLKNTGDGVMTLTAITVDANFFQSNTCGGSLAIGASCTVAVRFTPGQVGDISGSLTFQDNADDSPQTVRLSGTAVGAGVELTPQSVDFGPRLLGSSGDAKTISLKNSGNAALTINSITAAGDFAQTNDCPSSLAAAAICTLTVTFTPTAVGPRNGAINLSDNAGSQSVSLTGRGTGRPDSVITKKSNQQYTLAGNSGSDWQVIDAANLTLSIPSSTAPGQAILSGNADLWTESAGVNQDIGIFVNDVLVAWKESGGFAGTFSPNAAFVQTTVTLVPGKAYSVTLKWKTNHLTGGKIHAGAGINPDFSPTTLTAQVLPGGVISQASTRQYTLAGSNGVGWQTVDGAQLALTIPASSTPGTAIVSGNSDLWTQNAGVNQDIGLFVSDATTEQLVAWKESGGFAGTYSPNAAYVQASITLAAGKTYTVTLKWKTNHPTGGTIRAGAGLDPNFSPTTLTAQVLDGASYNISSTRQYTLANSTGSNWQLIDGTALELPIPASAGQATAILSGNADLWTENAGVNQDIGLLVSATDGSPSQLAAWKESGGFAGTFSPNAAFVQTSVTLLPGKSYTIALVWKANHPTGGKIHAGAGLDPNFSPTTLTALIYPGS